MSIDPTWGIPAVTALDMSAITASENIVNTSHDAERHVSVQYDDYLGGKGTPPVSLEELTSTIRSEAVSAYPLAVAGNPGDTNDGMIQPVAYAGESNAIDMLREMAGVGQMDQGLNANLTAQMFPEQSIGRIVNFTA